MHISKKLKELRDFYRVSLFSKKKGNSIGSRLLILVLAVSSLFVVLQTLVQLNNDYRLGLSEIDRRFDQLNLSYGGGLSRSIWEVNNSQILSTIEGMLAIPDISSVTVRETSENTPLGKGIVLAEVGARPQSRFREKVMPIMIQNRGKNTKIGSLTIVISLDTLYDDLYGTVIFIVIFQMIKTFLMSAFILAIFHYLVTRHLTVMADFANDTHVDNVDNLDESLVLNRKKIGDEDEISAMLDAINETRKNLKQLIKSSDDSMQLKLDIAQREEREANHKLFKEQTEAKNAKLAESNSELESAIDELKNTQDKLVNSEKLAALGGMVQGVAHELNTPIGLSITGASHIKSDTARLTELLSQSKMKKSDLDDYLESTTNLTKSICISLDKAANLIRSFKLVSVEQHEEIKQVFNVNSNLADILYSINPTIKEKNITVLNQIPEDININSFPGVFYQIYTNLINNATLHAFEGLDSGEITIIARFEDNKLHLSFSDNGKGMSKEVLGKVFDPFFTTKRANGGTGLGMSIIYNLVNDKLFGSIEVASIENQGTTFDITVPTLD